MPRSFFDLVCSDRDDEEATRALAAHVCTLAPEFASRAAHALQERRLPADVAQALIEVLDRSLESLPPAERRAIHECTARAALWGAPDDAFALLRPHLVGRDPERAEAVLWQIEEALRAASAGSPLLDPRFEAEARALRTSACFAHAATLVVDGFRHFAGEPTTPVCRAINLGEGDDPPFPFVVAGFVNVPPDAPLSLPPDRPSGLSTFAHQHGGLACLQVELLGYGVVPAWTAAQGRALASLERTWTLTQGEAMTGPDLAEWSEPFRDLAPSGFIEGTEALLIGPPGSALAAIHGAAVIDVRDPLAPWRPFADPRRDRIDHAGTFDERHERTLRALGLRAPQLVLLWGNSD